MKIKFVILASYLLTVFSCSGGGGSDAAAGSTDTNKFTSAGTNISIDGITSSLSGSSVTTLTTQTYYGRFFSKSGGSYYAGSVHFTLNKNDNTTAYFSNFFLDRMVQLTAYNTNSVIVNSATDLVAPGAYNATTNSIQIQDASKRYVSFKLDFGNNANIADIPNAGIIFSKDFSTMIGGDNSTFFFIAQKASSLPGSLVSDLLTSWKYVNFSVTNGPVFTLINTGSFSVSGTGGNGLTAFTGSNSAGSVFQGETTINDSGAGIFLYGYDSTPGGTPTADGTVDGGFLLSPDKQYILGFDFISRNYFGASR